VAADLSGWVVNVTWAELQPSNGNSIASNNPIDQALSLIATNPTYSHMHLRIRLMAGLDSPGWVLAMDGGPVYVYNETDDVGGNVPRFWTAPVEAAYANLEQELAAKYDTSPAIEDVTTSGCMTIYAEPLILETTSSETVADLLAAGYTVAADQACQTAALQAQTAWTHTHSSIALNPYDSLSGSTPVIDEAFTVTVMQDCRQILGSRCTLGNNSIRSTSLGSDYDSMYASMKALGPGMYFQTATSAKVGDLQTTVSWAIAEGANDVELPSGYSSLLSSSQMAADNLALNNNRQ
jgi:hypothetical protein